MDLKALLYVFRVLKTGIHLLRTGEVVADLPTLLEEAPVVPGLDDLVHRKRAGSEHGRLASEEGVAWSSGVTPLFEALDAAAAESALPEEPSAGRALDAFVIDIRLHGR